MPPRAAYIHVPFCRHHCGYCNFTVVAGRDDLQPAYLTALERELALLGEPHEVDTLFIGGGTPTHLAPDLLERLLALTTQWFPPASGAEFSVEANPADITPAVVDALARGGVNRVSLGAQSFSESSLALLERDHGPAQVRSAIELLRPRLKSLSLDLIFAVPGQTLEAFGDDLGQALALPIDHLSTYGLTIERGTTFFNRREHGQLVETDEELQRGMFLGAIDRLTKAGFEHYEVSNFARPDHRCRHNEVYWAGDEYFAAGPGAARYVDGAREVNHRSTTTWLRRIMAGSSAVAESERLSPEDRAREALVLGLRRRDGVDPGAFAARFGFTVPELGGAALRKFQDQTLIVERNGRVQLSHEGLLVSDALWPELLRA